MILHIGGDVAISDKDIVVILDAGAAAESRTMRDYLHAMKADGRLIELAGDMPKSYIIAKKTKGTCVYASPISSATLAKRWGTGGVLKEL